MISAAAVRASWRSGHEEGAGVAAGALNGDAGGGGGGDGGDDADVQLLLFEEGALFDVELYEGGVVVGLSERASASRGPLKPAAICGLGRG